MTTTRTTIKLSILLLGGVLMAAYPSVLPSAPGSEAGSGRAKRTESRANPFEGRQDAILAGAKLYRRYCAACHGKQAEGIGRAPALDGLREAPNGLLFKTLTNGVMKRGMPSWSHLPEQQRWQIITFLKRPE